MEGTNLVDIAAGDNGPFVPRVGGNSLTSQVLDALVDAIRTGVFPDGRLPSEDRLADQLAVSRTTLRRALQSLEQLGFVERRPGRGTRLRRYVRPDMLALHGLVPFPVLLRELGHVVASSVEWRQLREPPCDLRACLNRTVDGPVYEARHLLRADGVPAIAMTERFPADVLAREPTDEDFAQGSILHMSSRCFRDKIDHAVTTIVPSHGRAADNPLALEVGAPCLVLDEVFYSAEEIPLATSLVSVNPKFVLFSVFRRFP